MIRRTLAAGIAVATMIVLAGCTNAADRRPQADRLHAEISAMPGVDSVTVDYANDSTQGTYLDLTISMRKASEAQIADVVDCINAIKRHDFDNFQQSADFTVGDQLELKLDAALDPARISTRANMLRELGASLPGAAITWSTSAIEIEKSPPTTDSLAAVRTVLGGDRAQVTIRPANRAPGWTVDLPFSTQQEHDIQALLTDLPAQVAFVRVTDGHIANLSVGVHSPDTAYQDLTAIIASTRTSEHPMDLRWNWGSYTPDKLFTGSVKIAGCTERDSAADAHPERYLTPDAIALQGRLRSEFEICN
ncbi:hypothetical protein [Nocardia sp. NPDC005998]|uniref:hypothetical protein n=1 Tax=Nocardia sp. NPDC005998 TaxID=3156894 RepID=UPI0033BA10E4